MQNYFNGGGSPWEWSKSVEHLLFHSGVWPAVGTLNTRATAPPKQPFAWMASGQQPGMEETVSAKNGSGSESGKQAFEWDHQQQTQTGKPSCDRSMPSLGYLLLSALPLAQGCPKGASANESGALRDSRCLAPSKGPFKAALSPPPTQEPPNQLELLSSPRTLKVRFLAD